MIAAIDTSRNTLKEAYEKRKLRLEQFEKEQVSLPNEGENDLRQI